MMSAELVPTDQPYGQRQETEATRRQFGVPVDAAQPPSGAPTPDSPVPASGGGLGFDPLREIDPLGVGTRAAPAPSFRENLLKAVAASPNAAIRDIARRMLGEGV